MVALIFVAAFATLALSFWPYMIPFVVTIDEAAAPHASLAFMFWGAGLFVFPLMLLYMAIGYSVFRGKSGDGGVQTPLRTAGKCARQRAVNRSDVHRD